MKKPPGRPRDDSADTRIIEAALDILNEDGLVGLSVDGIAARAGVSKATIYRRWQSKDEVLVDAIASVVEAVEIPDSGDIRSDLVAAVRGIRGFVCDTRAGGVFPWLVGEIASQSEIGRRYASTVIGPRRAMMAGIVARAIERGDIRPVDVGIAVDMITGAVIVRRLMGGFDSTPDSWAEDLVDSLLLGWRSR